MEALTMTEPAIPDEDRNVLASEDKNLAVGRRYRFEHLSTPVVLKDMYFGKDDPGPGVS